MTIEKERLEGESSEQEVDWKGLVEQLFGFSAVLDSHVSAVRFQPFVGADIYAS